jgi:serine phosphatase RsbU (regulator of sigma subunit)
MTLTKAIMFLISGMLAGILSKTIRNSVLSSLESQRVLIEELDTKVSEKTAELNRQKEIVEEKQREILGSIAYAKRLQQAILVQPEQIGKYLPESFLMYKPKDIVAGDFYFFEVTGEKIFIAAADCTGHGVPGAMVSMVCSNALTRCVREFRLSDPGKILDKARELVIETFEKSGQDVKDGMDISLVAMDRNTREIRWAGSNNPLWYVDNGALRELKGDKQPIGRAENMKAFTTHKVEATEDTCFYLITDGFADQFGGPKGKKFKYRQLKEKINEIHLMPFDIQHANLVRVLNEWKGDMEQVDDICIIGFRA